MATKVLIVEDEDVLRDVLKTKLEKEGFVVSTARDGDEGLKRVTADRPDVILLDIVMPKKNGYDVLEALQKDDAPMPSVIIISNSGQPVEIDRALSLGARDYIVKAQFTPEEVIAKVRRLMDERQRDPTSFEHHTTIRGPEAIGLSVLVVEDDQFLRDLLTQKLQREGFRVLPALEGKEALRIVATEKPDAVLLDIILPGIDGFEVLRQLRGHPDKSLSQTPVILLSNLGQETDVEKGMKLGADDYLIKANFTIDEIIAKVKDTVKKRKKP